MLTQDEQMDNAFIIDLPPSLPRTPRVTSNVQAEQPWPNGYGGGVQAGIPPYLSIHFHPWLKGSALNSGDWPALNKAPKPTLLQG